MRRAVLASAAVAAAALAVTSPASARPTQIGPPPVCEGLTICVPIAGPWVVVPGPAGAGRSGAAVWQLSCPDGVVGGLYARASRPWIDVSFPGRIGSPVNPGVTTGQSAVFNALSVGPPGRPASFIPFIGCIPSQGGPRQPSGLSGPARSAAGDPIVRRMRVLEVRAGRPARAGFACGSGEHPISIETPIGIYSAIAPTAAQLRSVHVTRSVSGGRVFVRAVRRGLRADVAAQVQIHLLCARTVAG